jgi:hypothetical protein
MAGWLVHGFKVPTPPPGAANKQHSLRLMEAWGSIATGGRRGGDYKKEGCRPNEWTTACGWQRWDPRKDPFHYLQVREDTRAANRSGDRTAVDGALDTSLPSGTGADGGKLEVRPCGAGVVADWNNADVFGTWAGHLIVVGDAVLEIRSTVCGTSRIDVDLVVAAKVDSVVGDDAVCRKRSLAWLSVPSLDEDRGADLGDDGGSASSKGAAADARKIGGGGDGSEAEPTGIVRELPAAHVLGGSGADVGDFHELTEHAGIHDLGDLDVLGLGGDGGDGESRDCKG